MSEELQSKISALRSDYENLLEEIAMADVTKELGDTATQIAGLPEKIKEIRSAGYAYANYLENKTETLDRQWAEVRYQIEEAIRRELSNAQEEVETLDNRWDALEAALNPSAPAKPRGTGLGGIIKAAQQVQSENKPSAGGAGMMGALQKASGAGKTPSPSAGGGMLAALQKAATANTSSSSSSSANAMSSLAGGLAGKAIDTNLEGVVSQLEGAMKRTKDKLSSAKERIRGLYGQVPANVSQTYSQLRDINKYIERTQNATFDFRAGEDVYMVIEAEWKKTGKDKDDPNGWLYITNQRIIMEQAEKQGGFLGFGGKKVEGLLWDAPIGSIQKVGFEKKGLLGRVDLIHLQFGAGGPAPETTLEIHEGGISAKWFASKLQQAVAGDIEKERGLERSQAEVAILADAPTTCPVCGASFTEEIVRGQTQMQCSYCSSVVRLGAS